MQPPRARLNLNSQAWKSIRERYATSRPRSSEVVRYAAMGRWLSFLESASRGLEGDRCDVLPALATIVGHWRSGTTLAHELLCSHPDFAFPSTYACFNPHAFLMARGRPTGDSDTEAVRPMDEMVIRRNSPQEDEFALLCMGAASPYETLLFPQGISRIAERSNPANWSPDERARWVDAFRHFVCGCAMAAPGRRMLLKSPAHSFRLTLIQELAPGAKFIALVRDPRAVFASTKQMWLKMWERYALVPAATKDIDGAIIETIMELDAAIEAQAARLAPGAVLTIRYEDLVAEPERNVRRMLAFIGCEDREFPPPLEERLARVRAYKPSAWTNTGTYAARVEEACGPLLQKYGYRVTFPK